MNNNSNQKKIFAVIVLFLMVCSSFYSFSQFEQLTDKKNSNQNNSNSFSPEFYSIETQAVESNFDNKTHRYIFLYSDSLSLIENNSLFAFFESKGGKIEQNPWENIHGFAGTINNSEDNLGAFIDAFPPMFYSYDSTIQIQMNNLQDQINIRPEIASWNNGTLKGTQNASIAIIDTGIDYSHSFFNYSYENENFNHTIVGWSDLISKESLPVDMNGHGTNMAAIISGNDEISAQSNHSGDIFYLTKDIEVNHEDYFFPHHLSEKWYDIKLASFEMDENALDLLKITANLSIESSMLNYRLELYRNGNLINDTSQNPIELSWDTSGLFDTAKKPGVYDIVFSYYKTLEQNPQFSLHAQVQFTPAGYPHSFSEYSGIAPESRLTIIRALNNTGQGYISDFIAGLEQVLANISSKHIITLLISAASFDIPSVLQHYINDLVEKIILQGCMVIFAAGNTGVADKLNSLAVSNKALIVGAVNDQDQLTEYSAQSPDSNSLRSPDILAPGGSRLLNSHMVISAESNMGGLSNSSSDEIMNDLSAATGTSISAAVVAGVYNLIVDYLGGWNYWNSGINKSELAMKIKNYLLLTASETNLPREDNPNTPFDESSNSPLLDRGEKDQFEGYGRINPEAVLNMLNNSVELNHTYQLDLTASDSGANDQHVFALNITLIKDQLYVFNLTNNEGIFSNFDVDLYLYDTEGTRNGTPLMVASSTQAGNADEILYFTNLNETDTYYLVIKAVSGAGSCDLVVYPKTHYSEPILSNPQISVQSDLGYNDTLDTYRFEINYTQSDDIPATRIDLIFPDINKNYSLAQTQTFDTDYENGAIYYTDVVFNTAGNFSFYFIALTGNLSINYLNHSFSTILVNPIHHFAGNNFSTDWGLMESLWDFDYEEKVLYDIGINDQASIGWHPITISQDLEYRRTATMQDYWKSWYFGYVFANNSTFEPLVHGESPFFTYENTTGTYTLTSPIVWLENLSTPEFSPILELGSRISIDQGDNLLLEININRTEWENLDSWTEEQSDWSLNQYNLSEYINNYVQIRLSMEVESSRKVFKKGVFIDHLKINWENKSNNHQPVLSAVYLGENQQIPTYSTENSTKWGNLIFTIGYWDEDGDYPEEVVVEMDQANYSLFNLDGMWQTGKFNQDKEGQIIFSCEIPIVAIKNSSFRFHASDGKYNISTPWFNLELPDKYEIMQFPVENTPASNKFLKWGFPHNSSFSTWNSPATGWHQVQNLNYSDDVQEWYCGDGDYAGYSQNYKARLYSPVFYLNASHEAFLFFSHRLRFDSEGNEGEDFGEILISDDLGISWNSLKKFETETTGLDFKSVAIDLTNYNHKEIILQFYFSSDDSGEKIQNSGWKIRDISLNINVSKDYIPPSITFANIESGDYIKGVYNLTIYLSDNSLIDKSRTEMWVDNHQIEVNIDSNNTISILIDTYQYENGYSLEIIIVVYDIEGNRQFEKVNLIIKNPPSTTSVIFYSFIGVFGVSMAILYGYNEYKKRKMIKAGTYVRKPTIFERYQQKKFEANKIKEESLMILERLDPEWEKEQPMKLYCKKCHRMYLAPEFEIYCPHCEKSTLYVSKYCPVCKKWNYFDEDSLSTKCAKCGLTLVKDFDQAKIHILEHQHEEGLEEKIGEDEKETLHKLAAKLSFDELSQLYEKIRQEISEDDQP